MPLENYYGIRYRFTCHHIADGRWGWRCHGVASKGWLASEYDAARDLASRLMVPVRALLKSGSKRVSKCSPIAGVSWHSGQIGWVHKSGTGGVFFTPAAAAKAAKHLVPKAKAKAKAEATPKVCKTMFKHVYWHRQHSKWYVRHPEWPFHSYFDCEWDAANALADELDIDVDMLVIPARANPADCIQKLKLFLGVYAEALPRGHDKYPGDLADDNRRAEASQSSRNVPPPVEMISVLARCGPIRDVVATVYNRNKWPVQTDTVSDEEVAALDKLHTDIIRGVYKLPHVAELLKPYAANVMKQVRHFHNIRFSTVFICCSWCCCFLFLLLYGVRLFHFLVVHARCLLVCVFVHNIHFYSRVAEQ